jgi:hypothetical protein
MIPIMIPTLCLKKSRQLLPVLALLLGVRANAETSAAPDARLLDTFTTKDGKYTITVDSTASPDLREWFAKNAIPKVVDWYPKIIDLILSPGDKPPTKMTLTLKNGVIIPGNPGVPAYASGGGIVVSSDFMRSQKDGEAVGCIIHEMTHIVQSGTGGSKAPGWSVEGVADWVRWYQFEPRKKGAEISDPSQAKYDGSYRVSANFLNWVMKSHDKQIIRELTHTMSTGYSDDFWIKTTGKPISELEAKWKKSLK